MPKFDIVLATDKTMGVAKKLVAKDGIVINKDEFTKLKVRQVSRQSSLAGKFLKKLKRIKED